MGRVDVKDPGVDIQTVSLSDVADLPDGICRALIVGSAGAIKLDVPGKPDSEGKQTRVTRTISVLEGYLLIQAFRVWSTGTTVDFVNALY